MDFMLDSLGRYLPQAPTDFVEVGVLFLGIYWVLHMVKGTVAGSILRGAIIAVALGGILLTVALRAAGLQVLELIVGTLFTLFALALLVVFQPELRRGLLSLGEHRLFHRFVSQPKRHLDQLTRAVVQLARDRHGALFAIERHNQLPHIAETGVPIDSVINQDLIRAIFWPKAPLHDGGVVIRDDRIVAAGCIFPLAERQLATQYGTRHRAGIGMSEESTAVVVIVSEETGTVSVAADGVLRKLESPTELRDVLTKLLSGDPQDDESEPKTDAPDAQDKVEKLEQLKESLGPRVDVDDLSATVTNMTLSPSAEAALAKHSGEEESELGNREPVA